MRLSCIPGSGIRRLVVCWGEMIIIFHLPVLPPIANLAEPAGTAICLAVPSPSNCHQHYVVVGSVLYSEKVELRSFSALAFGLTSMASAGHRTTWSLLSRDGLLAVGRSGFFSTQPSLLYLIVPSSYHLMRCNTSQAFSKLRARAVTGSGNSSTSHSANSDAVTGAVRIAPRGLPPANNILPPLEIAFHSRQETHAYVLSSGSEPKWVR